MVHFQLRTCLAFSCKLNINDARERIWEEAAMICFKVSVLSSYLIKKCMGDVGRTIGPFSGLTCDSERARIANSEWCEEVQKLGNHGSNRKPEFSLLVRTVTSVSGLPLHWPIDKVSVLIGAIFIVSGMEVCGILMKGAFSTMQHRNPGTHWLIQLNKWITK
jgi:hypothetical protein